MFRNDKGRKVAEIMPGDRGGDDRRQDHRGKGHQSEITQDDFQGEEHPGNGRVEGGGDPRRGPASHHGFHVHPGDMKELGHAGADGGADLHNGTFPAHGPTGSDAHRRGQDLDDGDPLADEAVTQSNGLHATLQVSGDMDNLIKALASFPVSDFDIERPSLEEIFLTYYEAASEEAD